MTRIIVNNVLYGASDAIVEYVRRRIPSATGGFTPQAVGLGVVREGKLAGGVVFDLYTERDIVMSGAFDNPRGFSRRALKQLFSYPFVQLGCRRMTTITPRNNKKARALDEALGFKVEGVLRKAYPNDIDGMVYGMLREDCLWLKEGGPTLPELKALRRSLGIR